MLLADFKSVFVQISTLSYKDIWILCILQIITIVLINIQWIKISSDIGLKIKFIDAFDMNMTGTFFESITPAAKTGGEVAKVMFLKSKLGFSLGEASAVVSFQKIISMVCFLFLTLLSLFMFLLEPSLSSDCKKLILFSFLFLLIVVLVMILIVVYRGTLGRFFSYIPFLRKYESKLNTFLISFDECIQRLINNKTSFMFHIILSIGIWILFAVKTYYIMFSLGNTVKFTIAASVTYLTYMIGMLPLLPGGLGSFEASMMLLLSPVGISSSLGIAIALILRFVTFWFVFLLSSIYLGIKYIVLRRKEKALV
ncbi:hypothetical protein SAMN05661008_01015 [Alkalithermobacter thermoalcaliphilus JW-YL-7 = DSM 7308]|uniref:Phosphatidylglycerol lysyltransferase n=1 Tax=Alkalithermobacter thermoalcaliphilus JW-YL-7 = DSM 7308 TaxID=1121328 RepID=A0A150FNU6_CLOPD|nr:Lysylphosphatidylglycerol synthetase/glycosyltransferase AglD [[Clostridium] paradoxum JW-YL-7 = DSM 7308]SHK85438.1 hypothetical protein SAMN05661008_01015 [[Clostridium] paradoxum JW-YL-7 = DSM 7308]